MSGEFEIKFLGERRVRSTVDIPVFQDEDAGVLLDATVSVRNPLCCDRAVLELAGPRRELFFNPAATRAAIVTCGDVGFLNGHFVHVPMEKAVESRKRIDPTGLLWQSVLENTGQPVSLT